MRNIIDINPFYTLKNTGLDIIVISLLYFKLTVQLILHIGIYFSKTYYIFHWTPILMKLSLVKYLPNI